MCNISHRQFEIGESSLVCRPLPKCCQTSKTFQGSAVSVQIEQLIISSCKQLVIPFSKTSTYLCSRPAKFESSTERKLQIHPKSVNFEEAYLDSKWIIYHLKMKTTQVSRYFQLNSMYGRIESQIAYILLDLIQFYIFQQVHVYTVSCHWLKFQGKS